MEEMEIIIDKNGKVNIEVKGVKGPSCKDLTRELEEALGEVEKRTFKTGYYQSEEGSQTEQNKTAR